jgi:predicted transposase YbfD/YdcC
MVAATRSLPSYPTAPNPPARRRKAQLPALLPYLAQVPDPRSSRGRRHSLPSVLGLVVLAMLCDRSGYRPASQWGRKLLPAVRRRLGFDRFNVPAGSTLHEVLAALDWEALEKQLRNWAQAWVQALGGAPLPGEWKALAIDGKKLRGSWKRGAALTHLLAVATHHEGLLVAQTVLPEKKGELTGLRALLPTLVLDGLVVTLDAQFTHRDIGALIQKQGGDYVFRVKGNQPKMQARIKELLGPLAARPELRTHSRTYDTKHGRREERRLYLQPLAPGELDWPGAAQVFMLETSRQTKRGVYAPVQRYYGLTTLPTERATAAQLLQLVRGHWTIENRVFWVRDVLLREDAHSATNSAVVAVLALLRGAALTLLRAHTGGSVALALNEYTANPWEALNVLGFP